MIQFILKILNWLTGQRILAPEQVQSLEHKVQALEHKNQALDQLATQLKQQVLELNQTHQTQLQNIHNGHNTERTQRENEAKHLKTQLEQMQLSIEQVLANQFKENQSLLTQLNWLSGTIAHDFRAPLRAIDANSFFLEDDLGDQGPPDAKKSLGEIRRNGKRMGVLIDGLLDYLRIGIAPLAVQDVDVGDVIRQVIAQDFAFSPIDMPLDLHLQIRGDKVLLQRLFKELIDNAVKFSAPVDRPKVKIRLAGPKAIEILDNGVGFSAAYRDQLFKLFHRLHGNDEFPGEGIGLCIADRIAQRHNGQLSLDRTAETTVAYIELGDLIQPKPAN
ncbi:MAG: ATP-binding protein [Limnobacter sp.]|nr:ATP-binding protein [Limnobacter sp.]